MTWDLVIYAVVALVALLLGAGPSRRRRRPPERHWVRETRPTYEMAYKDGFQAGYRAGQAKTHLPPALWQQMLVLVHHDHHEGSPLHPMAAEVTRWFLMHRPRAGAEMN